MTRWYAAIVVIFAVAAGAVVGALLPPDQAPFFLGEAGPVEIVSAILWFLLAAVAAVIALRKDLGALVFALLAALAGGRELDIQMRFTSESMINLRYWLRGSIPIEEKLITALVVVAVLSILAVGMKRQLPALREGLRSGEGAAWTLTTIVVAVPVLMMFDRVGRFYPWLAGGDMDPAVRVMFSGAEEVGELVLPVLGFVVMGQAFEREQKSSRTAAAPVTSQPDPVL